MESCNALNDLSNRLCVPDKIEVLNLNVFNMITGINESKTLTKHISCNCECKFGGSKCNSNQKCNNGKCQYECINYQTCIENYSWNPNTYICENGKYSGSITVTDNSAIMCDESFYP